IQSGLQAGGWSADKIQDFMKEGAIRLDSEAPKTYDKAGLFEEYMQYQDGKVDYKGFLELVQKSLKGASKEDQKGAWAAVSGTQGEDIDLGTIEAIVNSDGLKVDSDAAKNLQKDIDSMPVTKFNAAWAKFKQDFQPTGDMLLNIATAILPKVNAALAKVTNVFNGLGPTGKNIAIIIGLIGAAAVPVVFSFGLLAGSVTKMINLFSLFNGRGDKTTGKLSMIGHVSKGAASALKKIGPIITGLAKGALNVLKGSLKGVGVAVKIVNSAMRANPVGLVITAIGLLVAGLIYAYKHSESFRKIVNKVFDALKAGGKKVKDFTIAVIKDFHKLRSNAVDKM
ncbi:hypothetical protein, partial [Bacillus sp. mrc49]|uniref:hypothetical protein n=1 Tax=Bacillus sp. mrc49 TaxID=2054913 RepID=UPI000CC8E004